MFPNLRGLLNEPLQQFEKLPCSAEDLDTIHVRADHEFTRFIYDPITNQTEHPEAPSWCVSFVDLLKSAVQFKEWVHTMHR